MTRFDCWREESLLLIPQLGVRVHSSSIQGLNPCLEAKTATYDWKLRLEVSLSLLLPLVIGNLLYLVDVLSLLVDFLL